MVQMDQNSIIRLTRLEMRYDLIEDLVDQNGILRCPLFVHQLGRLCYFSKDALLVVGTVETLFQRVRHFNQWKADLLARP